MFKKSYRNSLRQHVIDIQSMNVVYFATAARAQTGRRAVVAVTHATLVRLAGETLLLLLVDHQGVAVLMERRRR